MSRPLKPLSTLLLATAGALACAHVPEAEPPRADEVTRRVLPAGEVVGTTSERGAHVWRGLPFAEPPVGELRWKAPRPAPAWEGVREALESGPACVQPVSMLTPPDAEVRESGLLGDEDCLHLNVYAPPFAADEIPTGGA